MKTKVNKCLAVDDLYFLSYGTVIKADLIWPDDPIKFCGIFASYAAVKSAKCMAPTEHYYHFERQDFCPVLQARRLIWVIYSWIYITAADPF
jgi:hypothetical protein